MNAVTDLGTHNWVDRTGGQLTGAERRSLLRPLARTHAVNAVGRLSMLARLNSGLRAQVDPARLVPPSSALTRAAVEQAQRRLSPALLNHSYRTFAFGAALGALEGLTVDRELLFAAALLHDTGLPTSESERRLHPDQRSRRPGRRRRGGPVLRRHRDDAHRDHAAPQPARHRWRTAPWPTCCRPVRAWTWPACAPGSYPRDVLASVVEQHPRLGFKGEFAAAFRAEAARVPTRARAVPAPLRGFRPRHQARALPRLTALRSSSRPAPRPRHGALCHRPSNPLRAAPRPAIPVDPPV